MNQAVFLDRDGVINPNVFNPTTSEWESPHREEDFEIYPGVLDSIRMLRKQFRLFLVSNQPSYAKGKTSLENIKGIHKKFKLILEESELSFDEYYYCYHHPHGVVPEYSGVCRCRKPNSYFIDQACEKYNLKREFSWMVGDRVTDIECGKSSGLKTVFINHETDQAVGSGDADFVVTNLLEAAKLIMEMKVL